MSYASRLQAIFRSKASRALDRAEDPRETLDDSYDQQVNLLQQVRQGLAEVATARKRIELQGQEMGARYGRLSDQAQEALNQGREDLARSALERRSFLESQVAALRDQHDVVAAAAGTTAGQRTPSRRTGRGVSDREGNDQGHLHCLPSASQSKRGRGRYRLPDERCRRQPRAGQGPGRTNAGPRRRHRRAPVQRRAQRFHRSARRGPRTTTVSGCDESESRAPAAVDEERRPRQTLGAGSEPSRKGPDAWLSIGQGPNTP